MVHGVVRELHLMAVSTVRTRCAPHFSALASTAMLHSITCDIASNHIVASSTEVVHANCSFAVMIIRVADCTSHSCKLPKVQPCMCEFAYIDNQSHINQQAKALLTKAAASSAAASTKKDAMTLLVWQSHFIT